MSQTSSRTQDSPLTTPSILAIRLIAVSHPSNNSSEASANGRTTPSSVPGSRWNSESPAAKLTRDLLSASNASSIRTEQDTLVAFFETVPQAISASRKLCWALQGHASRMPHDFLDAADPAVARSTTLLPTIVIDTGTDYSSAAANTLLCAIPGQILLTASATHKLENLPGLPIGHLSDSGLRELLRDVPLQYANASSPQPTDEELLQQQFSSASASATPIASGIPATPPDGVHQTEPAEKSRSINPQSLQAESSQTAAAYIETPQSSPAEVILESPASRRWLLIGGMIAIATILVAAITYRTFHPRTASRNTLPIATAPVTPQDPPSPSQPDPHSFDELKAGHSRHMPQNLPAQPATYTDATTKAAAEPSPRKPPQACDLSPSQLQSTFNAAESQYQRGNYKLAILSYGKVLACDPHNTEARRGATRSRSFLEQQSTPEP